MKVSPNQLSLFDQPIPEPTKAEEPRDFIIWYANMMGHGEHIYSRFADGGQDFAPAKMIIEGTAEPILFNSIDVQAVREKRHARLGKLIWKGNIYEIEEIWEQPR
jgi:hypothetical protein